MLLFPTLSDGFGMAQIEARAWRMPIIASRRCGSVVRQNVTGLLLNEPSAQAIADAIGRIADPELLTRFAAAPDEPAAEPLTAFAGHLMRLAQ